MKILKTANYKKIKKAQWGMGRYERVVIMQNEDANEALQILDNQGEAAAINHLSQWHNPGEHETSEEPGFGGSDSVFESDGYILSYNERLGYIALSYDTKKEKQDMGTWEIDNPNM